MGLKEKVCKLEKLCTLILIATSGGLGITIEELKAMPKKLKKLRVVHVDVQGHMVTIPGCICELKHLRCLRIHSPWSGNVQLPKKLDTIYHLQILELCGAGVLDFSNVQNISHLISLRDIRNSSSVFPNSDVSGFPGIGTLSSPDLQVEIPEGLFPLSQLTELEICQYDGLRCPSWLSSENQNGLFRNLQDLQISQCKTLKDLPELGDLFVRLRCLKLAGLPKLKRLPRFPDRLEDLNVQQCKALVVTCKEDVNMIRSLFVERATQIEPSLNITATEVVEIDSFACEQPYRFDTILCDIFGRCGSLPGELIHGHFTLPASVVDRLIVSHCFVTETVLHNCLRGSTSLSSLNIRCLPSEVMRSLTNLSDLSVGASQFSHLQGLNHLSRLQQLSITECPNLRTLGEDEKLQSVHGLVIDDITLAPQLLSTEGCSSMWCLRIDE
uniref:R13L1/DRL21-like LRR repeat region domain-containing protein n=1 Tax=Oryza punctata TaxID=4537 RepID=A0A0E0KM66_ORYPU